jgi:hypothetical protein
MARIERFEDIEADSQRRSRGFSRNKLLAS